MDSDPILDTDTISLKHTSNRIRVNPHSQQTGEYLTATMSENGDVYIFDLASQFKAFDTPGFVIPKSSKDQFTLFVLTEMLKDTVWTGLH